MADLPAPRHRRVAAINLASHYVNLALTVVQGLVLVPLYLRHIPTGLYGAWLATGNVLAWIELVDPGVSGVLQQRVAFTLGRRDRPALGGTIGTGLALSLGIALLPLPLLLVAGQVAGLVGYAGAGAQDLAPAFGLALASTAISLASYGVTAVNVGLQQAEATGVFFIVAGLAGLAVTVAGLVGGLGLLSLPLGLLVRSSLLFLANLAWMARWCGRHLGGLVRFRRPVLRELLAPVGVTALSKIGVTLVTRMDAFVVSRVLGPGAVVTLTLTGKALDIVRLATDRIGASLMPGMAHLAGEGRTPRAAQVVHGAAGAIGALGAVGVGAVVALNGRFVEVWVGADHYGGVWLTAVMGAAAGIMTLAAVMGNFAFALGGVKAVARLALVEAVVRVPALVLLTSAMGLLGVPVAAILATLLVGTAWLPGVIAPLVGVEAALERRVWGGAVLRTLAGIGAGLALGALVDALGPPGGWPAFVALAAAVGAVLTALAVASDATLRQGLRAWLGPRFGWIVGG